MIQQLRINEIFDANADAFHARFRDHCLRIMAGYGFVIRDRVLHPTGYSPSTS
jgi:hypothetical protein